jgi:hypothetical protein
VLEDLILELSESVRDGCGRRAEDEARGMLEKETWREGLGFGSTGSYAGAGTTGASDARGLGTVGSLLECCRGAVGRARKGPEWPEGTADDALAVGRPRSKVASKPSSAPNAPGPTEAARRVWAASEAEKKTKTSSMSVCSSSTSSRLGPMPWSERVSKLDMYSDRVA